MPPLLRPALAVLSTAVFAFTGCVNASDGSSDATPSPSGLRTAALTQTLPQHGHVSLVRDLNSDVGGGYDFDTLVAAGPRAYFATGASGNAKRLWVTDGTTDGTFALSRLAPGDSSRMSLGTFRGVTYFDSNGLIRSDGTLHGTRRVHSGGAVLGSPELVVGPEAAWVLAFDGTGRTLFEITDPNRDPQPLLTLPPFTGTELSMGASLVVDGTLYFFRRDSLWRTDFTPAGTWEVQTPGIPVCSVALGDRFVVRTLPDVGDYAELWISDGTRSGTERISHMGSKWSAEATCTSLGNGRALVAVGGAAPELWTTDGTSAGTARLTDRCSSTDCGLTVIGDRAFFVRSSGFEREELWRTDGTAAGTERVFARESGNGFVIDRLTACGDRLHFFGGWVSDPEGLEPWVSDGTAAGTHVLTDTLPGRHVVVKARACIDGDLVWLEEGERRLWRSDGTAAGTTSYHSLASTPSGAPGPGAVAGGALIFSGTRENNWRSLWRTDGTPSGTAELTAPPPMFQPVAPDFVRFAPAGSGLMFPWYTSATGFEPWFTDGTPTGTHPLAEVSQGGAHSFPENLTPIDGSLALFTAVDAQRSVWRTDGTVAGTWKVSTGAFLSPKGTPMPRLGTGAVWLELDAVEGREPRFSDGVQPGAVTLGDSDPGGATGTVHSAIATAHGHTYFISKQSVFDTLWRTDGTAAGTTPLQATGFYGAGIVSSGDRLWYWSRGVWGGGERLEVYDDAQTSTPRIVFASGIRDVLPFRDGVIFTAASGANEALFYADGSTNPPVELARIERVEAASNTFELEPEGRLLFVADDGVWGKELWTTDGTARNTRRLTDVARGALDSSPLIVGRLGNRVLFAANDGFLGSELYALDLQSVLDDVPPVFAPMAVQVLELTTRGGTYAPFAVGAVDDRTSKPWIYYQPAPGSFLALGETQVTATALDEAGNSATTTFTVRVLDTTPPEVSCGANWDVVLEEGELDRAVHFAPATAWDLDGVESLTQLPPPGTQFAEGEHEVVAEATDRSGNVGRCAFTIRVRLPEAPVPPEGPDAGDASDAGDAAADDAGTNETPRPSGEGGCAAAGGAMPSAWLLMLVAVAGARRSVRAAFTRAPVRR